MGIKNFWSLNVDECLVACKLRELLNGWEVFFPLNSQLQDIDLAILNLKDNKLTSIQVKGSKTYEPRKSERERFGNGSGAWFRLNSKAIAKPKNKIDFYVFVLHNFIDTETKKQLNVDYLIIPNKTFQKLCLQKAVVKGGYYHFFIWIDSKGERSFDFYERNNKIINFSKFINNWALIK